MEHQRLVVDYYAPAGVNRVLEETDVHKLLRKVRMIDSKKWLSAAWNIFISLKPKNLYLFLNPQISPLAPSSLTRSPSTNANAYVLWRRKNKTITIYIYFLLITFKMGIFITSDII
jgi:hypothetical protein